MELKDVKEFFSDNKDKADVQEYIVSLSTDKRMMEKALETEDGQKMFNSLFDKKISEAKQKMEGNYSDKLESTLAEKLSEKEKEWVEKHKEKDEKSPAEIKIEEMQKQQEKLMRDLKMKDLYGTVRDKIPDSFRDYAQKLVNPDWEQSDVEAFAEKFSGSLKDMVDSEVKKKLDGTNNTPGKGSPGGGDDTYSKMSPEEIANLPEDKMNEAFQSIANNSKES